jgi:hypothetical protein
MPDRPGVDDNTELAALIQVWRTAAREIDGRLLAVWDRIRRELESDNLNRNTLIRLRRQADRLESLAVEVDRVMADLADETRAWITAGGLDRIYAAGAAVTAATMATPFAFTAPHRAAMDILARDLFTDVLAATGFVGDDAKRFARVVGRRITAVKIGTGDPVRAAARNLARDLEDGFRSRGMGHVVYRDGSRHSFAEYAEVLLRTKTAVVYNQGTLNHARALGIEWYELLDGADCGLTSHRDPQRANGLIVDAATAEAWPIAHPNCRRAVNPRPDLNASNVENAVSVQPPERRADQAAFERALREQGQARRERWTRRERRRRR